MYNAAVRKKVPLLYLIFGLITLGLGVYMCINSFLEAKENPEASMTGTYLTLVVFAFFAFIGQTIMSLVLYIMIQDTIDFNEYRNNERREAATFSLRAFSAKMASSIQQGLLYLFLTVSSLYVIQQQIADVEREFNLGGGAGVLGENYVFEAVEPASNAIDSWQLIVFHIGFTIVPMLMFLAAFLLIKFKYKINEKNHESIIKAVEARKEGKEYRDELLDELDASTMKKPKNKA
jgi:Na+/melibiose symporter-like transporter